MTPFQLYLVEEYLGEPFHSLLLAEVRTGAEPPTFHKLIMDNFVREQSKLKRPDNLDKCLMLRHTSLSSVLKYKPNLTAPFNQGNMPAYFRKHGNKNCYLLFPNILVKFVC
jgi:hypothetical protein